MKTHSEVEKNSCVGNGARYTRKLAAEYLGINVGTLAKWASIGHPFIPYHKLGKKVVYLQNDLDDFLANNRIDKRAGA